MPELPTGTVTFLFTDIEGSTIRWEHHPEAMRTALARHDALLHESITAHDGVVFKMVGDAVCAAFAVAADAVAAALAAQRAVAAEQWGEVAPLRVRMALHSGAAQCREGDYFGPALNRVARLLSTGYGGQILLSLATEELARDVLPAGVGLQDLGEHALKDLLRPEHVFQLVIPDLPVEFPALKSLSRQLHNLPMQPTPLIGREQEVATVCALLRGPEVRLVTLTGPAGVGKTRLGLQVAAELADQFADGVFLVALAPVNDPDLVVSALSQALGVIEMGTQPPLTLLKGALKDKHLLLLLDNFEQVVEAALVVAELLAACPRLKVLVTSRVVLHVRAEREYAVPPLSIPNLKRLPELAALSQYEAVALFIERALAIKPDFQVTNANAPAVAGICARLDGLPLAIELAAARVKYFPPQSLLVRLEQGLAILAGGARDLPLRQQTLRGALAWSYDLLAPEEQALFRRLAVFVDGCTWEAAEQVCTAAGQLDGDILEGLASLVDKSLLRQEEQAEGEARFRMLQVLREFGLEALASAGETEATREAHALYYLALVEEAEPHLRGAEQIRWFARLEQEHENLRAALLWLLEGTRMEERAEEGRQQAEQSLRLCAALYWFWYVRGYVREGHTFLEQALATSLGVAAPVRARALFAAADLAISVGDLERAERQSEKSLALFRELGDKAGIAASIQLLGYLSRTKCHYARARSQLEEARALFQELGDPWKRGNCLTELARIDTTQGEYDRARMLLEESLGIYNALGDQQRIGWVLYLLAYALFLSQTDPERAVVLAEQSLALMREGGSWLFIHSPLNLLGELRLMQGKQEQARTLFEESLMIAEEHGEAYPHAASLIGLAQVEACQGNLTAARRLYQEGLALLRVWAEKDREWLAACLMGLAEVVAVHREPAEAARLWGTAEALRETIGAPIPPVYRADYEPAVAAARSQLSEEAFAAAWAEGKATSPEQVINEALGMGG
jgi:predicted ATPase/class 3 adenylate cyclase